MTLGSHPRQTPEEKKVELIDLGAEGVRVKAESLNAVQKNFLLTELAKVVDRCEKLFGIQETRPVVRRDDRGVPYLRPGIDVTFLSITDCHDTETAVRMAAQYMGSVPEHVQYSGHILPVENYSTLHLGVIVASFLGDRARLPLHEQAPVVLLGNAAPRAGSDPNAVGTRFVLAELPANVFYFGTLDGSLSLVKDHVRSLHETDIEFERATTVFRSRFLPKTALRWVNGERDVIRRELPLALITSMTNPFQVYSVDNFGNIKTGLTEELLASNGIQLGDELFVQIGSGEPATVRYGKSVGDVDSGELVMAKGSTLHDLAHPDNRLLDIYVNNGSAALRFSLKDLPHSPIGLPIQVMKGGGKEGAPLGE